MSVRIDQLKKFIQDGSTDTAIHLVRELLEDLDDHERAVHTVLGDQKSAPELVEAALEAFLGTRQNRYKDHGFWVHSLSHFTAKLWERRMDGWIKKFNEVSFKGANELRDTNCSDRLVSDFGYYAKFDDEPVDFHLTFENLGWMNWEYALYTKARIEAGRFESQETYLHWLEEKLLAETDAIEHKELEKRIQKIRTASV